MTLHLCGPSSILHKHWVFNGVFNYITGSYGPDYIEPGQTTILEDPLLKLQAVLALLLDEQP